MQNRSEKKSCIQPKNIYMLIKYTILMVSKFNTTDNGKEKCFNLNIIYNKLVS